MLKKLVSRNTVSRVVVMLGIFVGLLGLAMTGQRSVLEDPDRFIRLLSRFQTFGPGILGLVFLAGSLVALRNRRRAALVFLAGTPIASFVLAYPTSGYLEKAMGTFELPSLSTAAQLACVFYLPFIGLYFAIGKNKRALLIPAVLSVVAVLILDSSWWTLALLPRLAASSAPFLPFLAFWFVTDRRDWPPLSARAPQSAKHRTIRLLFGSFSVVILTVVGILIATFGLTAFQSTTRWSQLCRGPGLFDRPVWADHASFTARIIWAGPAGRMGGRWVGDWAIGAVRERFWGLPAGGPQLVLIINNFFRQGDIFFVSGRRPQGLLTRFLPIVDTRMCVGLVERVSDAEVQLRVLKNPRSESRLIGVVRSPKPNFKVVRQPWKFGDANDVYKSALDSPSPYEPLAGTRISVTGPSVSKTVIADQKGVYEVVGLAPADYAIKVLDLPPNRVADERRVEKADFLSGKPIQLDLNLEWDGNIQGHVLDVNGKPAQPSISVNNPDMAWRVPGTNLNQRGEFSFEHLPPGRYLVELNSFGPDQGCPIFSRRPHGGNQTG